MATVKTKYNTNDTVYVLHEQKIQRGIILKIDIVLERLRNCETLEYLTHQTTKYWISFHQTKGKWSPEKDIASTPEELCNRLIEKLEDN